MTKAAIAVLLGLLLHTGTKEKIPVNAPPERVQQWQDQKFGLFIHWGPWSQSEIGGIWKIVRKDTTAKQRTAYFDLYKTFNPVNFDAEEWATLAKEAGMRYFVFTTKHHDGFCNWDTAFTDYKITDRQCPYSRSRNPDIVGQLVEAFRAEGLGVGLYFSHIDWHHPNGVWHNRHFAHEPDFRKNHPERWRNFVAFEHEQVRELITRYGDIDIFWFDISWPKEGLRDAVPMLRLMRQLQPNMLLDNRGTSEYQDFITPEQRVPGSGPSVPWETCMTISEGGGFWYKGRQAKYKSTEKLIRTLADVVSKGGNFLLNVGPQPDGRITPEETQRLKEVGQWMKVNGEAIYGTTQSPFRKAPAWGRVTQKGNKLYLIVFDWPAAGATLPLGLTSKIVSASLLKEGTPVRFKPNAEGTGIELSLPASPPSEHASVVVVEYEGALQVVDVPAIKPEKDGSLVLKPANAEIRGAMLRYQPDRNNLGAWMKATDYAQWTFLCPKAGAYRVEFTYGCAEAHAGNKYAVTVGKERLVCPTQNTGGIKTYKPFDLGTLSLPQGAVTLSVKPVGQLKGPLMNYRLIRLIPQR